MTAIASRITATAMDPTAALFIVSLISSVMYHADRSKEKRYSQARTMLNGKVSEPSFKGSACLRQATSHDIRASEASRRPFFSVAVGTALASGPPHGSVREGLPHTALTSGSCDGQPLVGIR